MELCGMGMRKPYLSDHIINSVLLRVSASVNLDQIHSCLLSQADVWCHRVCSC